MLLKPDFFEALEALERGNIEIVYPKEEDRQQIPRLQFAGMDYAEFAMHIKKAVSEDKSNAMRVRDLEHKLSVVAGICKEFIKKKDE